MIDIYKRYLYFTDTGLKYVIYIYAYIYILIDLYTCYLYFTSTELKSNSISVLKEITETKDSKLPKKKIKDKNIVSTDFDHINDNKEF
jgi:hypothetical protein